MGWVADIRTAAQRDTHHTLAKCYIQPEITVHKIIIVYSIEL